VCSRHHIHCSGGGDKASKVGNAVQILNAGPGGAGRAAAQADEEARPLRRNAGLVERGGTTRDGGTWAKCARTVQQRRALPVFMGHIDQRAMVKDVFGEPSMRYGADRQPALCKESRIWYSCCPVNQWVMHKNALGEPSMRNGKLLKARHSLQLGSTKQPTSLARVPQHRVDGRHPVDHPRVCDIRAPGTPG
jgi:hypothetical protein